MTGIRSWSGHSHLTQTRTYTLFSRYRRLRTMKNSRLSGWNLPLLGLAALLLLAIALASSWLPGATGAEAQGVSEQRKFVYCQSRVADGPTPHPSLEQVLDCTTEDGVRFDDNGTSVPSTMRFYLTDIILYERAYATLYQQRGDAMVTELRLGAATADQDQAHFISPYFVLHGGDKLFTGTYLYASGYVVSYQSLMPSISH
jgi:hypothetical protein